jgi:hypothetical protein
MKETPTMPDTLPNFVRDLATRLGGQTHAGPRVSLQQKGRIKRAIGKDAWMAFTARQTIDNDASNFAWHARIAPLGAVSVCDALDDGVGRLDVTALGFIPLVRTVSTPALVRGELMRYLAELAWAPDAILRNPALRWRETAAGEIVVGAGTDTSPVEVSFGLDRNGRIETAFASDRPRSAVEPILPTPWRGRFWDYRRHEDRWIPFAGEVAWVIDGREEIYWQGTIERWACGMGEVARA